MCLLIKLSLQILNIQEEKESNLSFNVFTVYFIDFILYVTLTKLYYTTHKHIWSIGVFTVFLQGELL